MTSGPSVFVFVIFVLTVLTTVGIFLFAILRAGWRSAAARSLAAFTIIWLVVQALLAINGFFQEFDAVPPRTFLFGPMPFFLLTFVFLGFARKQFLANMPLSALTLIHVIRIPIELVLLWLYQAGQVPIEMTFEGRNFDILSGITAPIVYLLAFRGGSINRPLLIIWNVAALGLLFNIVTIAILAFPSPFQMLGLDQPNIGVTYFPFIWLPGVVVPIVFFCHVVSLWKLISTQGEETV